jgi:hypothetical protein
LAVTGLDGIVQSLALTSERNQTVDRLLEAIGTLRASVCTYCWTGRD